MYPLLLQLTPMQRAMVAWYVFSTSCDCQDCCRWRCASHMARDYPNGIT